MATAGYTTQGGTRLNTNRGIYYRIQATADGTITSAFAYMDSAGVAVNARAVVYASSAQSTSGVPTGSPLATSSNTAINIGSGSPQWVEMTFSSPYSITNGTYFFIFVCTDNTGNWGLQYDNPGGVTKIYSTAINNSTIPDPVDTTGPTTTWDTSTYVVITTDSLMAQIVM